MMEQRDIELIRALQREDVFLTPSPFKKVAESLGRDLEDVLGRVRELKEAGVIRRFGAALTPRNAGFTANSMVVWEVGDGEAFSLGEVFASHPRVSHCYIRPRFEGFPFNVYTMIHGNSPEDLKSIIEELSKLTRITSYRTLHSLREFKKSSPVYYPGSP